MSQTRRLGVEFTGNASGYIGAVNQVLYGTRRVAQGFRDAASQSTILDNQAKAISTTFRYMLAGSIVFGITGALSRLNDFEQQLGTIDSLAGKLNEDGKFKGLGNQLQDLGSDAIVMSDHFGDAVTDVEDYMARFYSTFNADNLKNSRQQLDSFTTSILNLQAALGAEAGDPGTLAAGIGGLVNVIPGGKQNPGRVTGQLANMIAYLTQVTPNITGTDIANAAGRLASVYNTAGMTPQELFAIYAQAAKAGGSPSIVTRGVQQLLGQSLLDPKTPTNKAAYRAAGLSTDPTTLRNMGGVAVLSQLMQFVAPHGVSTAAARKASGATNAAQLQAALPGLNVTTLLSLFGRIQSVQQFVNILSQGGVPALQKMIKQMDHYANSTLAAQRAQDALEHNGLKRLNNAFSNMSLSIVRDINTPASKFADVVAKASDEMAKHRTTTDVVTGAGASAILLRLLGRSSLLSPYLSRVPIVGKLSGATGRLAAGAIMAEETANVIAGGAVDGTRNNPYWVIISPYSWTFGTGGMGYPIGGGPGPKLPRGGAAARDAEQAASNAAKAGGLAGFLSRLGLGGVVGKAGVVGAEAYGAYNLGKGLITGNSTRHSDRVTSGGDWVYALTHPGADLQRIGADAHGLFGAIFGGGSGGGGSSAGMLARNAPAIQAALAAAHMGAAGVRKVQVEGTAKADLTIHLVDKNGNEVTVIEKKGVPIAVTKDSAPHAGGRPGVKGGK